MIDIQNPQETMAILRKLTAETPAQFGIMTPQHMVEHLVLILKFSNGSLKAELIRSEETAKKWKQGLIYTDMEFPQGIKAPIDSEKVLPDLRFENLEKAIDKLGVEIRNFENFFKNEPEKEVMHPALGFLNYKEWVIFHNKHFKHHFSQFGLI